MATVQVFKISEVAAILGMPVSKVKNWTIGRPLTIKPSVRMAAGKGTQNLYGARELFLLGLAKHLVDDGFSLEVVGEILDQFRKEERIPAKGKEWLLVFREIRAPGTFAKRQYLLAKEPDTAKSDQAISSYRCNLRRLADDIHDLVENDRIFGFGDGL